MARATTVKTESVYGVHPGIAAMQKWVAELKDRTGRSLDEWIAVVRREGPKDERSRRDWLKTNFKLVSCNRDS